MNDLLLPAGLAVGGVLLVVLLSLVVMYNRFVRQRTLVESSWGGVDVELTRRHALIPNLVRTVEAYAEHERSLLEALARAREEAARHEGERPEQRQSLEEQVGLALGRVLARVEAYPELAASAGFLDLQHQLALTEDRIAAARRFYNNNVAAYNTRIRTFPSNLVAGAFGFAPQRFFELTDALARAVPDVRG